MVGLLVGVLPGIGPFLTMVLAYNWLGTQDPLSIILFYATMLIACQFAGSVTAIAYGIPGESTSYVASRVGFKYSLRGDGLYAMGITSFGSMLASVAAVVVIWVGINVFANSTVFYSARIQAVILLGVYVALLVSNQNRGFTLVQIIVASALSVIGYNELFNTYITFGRGELMEGLSWLPVVLAMSVVPTLYKELWHNDQRYERPQRKISSLRTVVRFRRYWRTWVRSSALGGVFGLIPGIGTIIVSTAVYFFEKRMSTSPARQLIAAESSNNSASVTSLIPLITFGIPITASEALLVNILQTKHTIVFMDWFVQPALQDWTRFEIIVLSLILTSLIAMLFSWQWVQVLLKSYCLQRRHLFIALMLVLMASMLYTAYDSHKIVLDTLTFLLLLPLGLLWRNQNVMAFLLSFIMFDNSSRIFYAVYKLI